LNEDKWESEYDRWNDGLTTMTQVAEKHDVSQVQVMERFMACARRERMAESTLKPIDMDYVTIWGSVLLVLVSWVWVSLLTGAYGLYGVLLVILVFVLVFLCIDAPGRPSELEWGW
jgi:hypothetical protein